MSWTWTDLGYGLALTVTLGTVLAFLLQWRDARARRAAEAVRRRLDRRSRHGGRREVDLDRAA